MASDTFTELVAAAVAQAQRPMVGVLEELRHELAETRRELHELREQTSEEQGRAPEPIYLSLPKVADRLGVSRRTARRWIDSGRLPHVRLPGGGVRVSVAGLERALQPGRGGRGPGGIDNDGN
jgi:excisionase family DNA binding protein